MKISPFVSPCLSVVSTKFFNSYFSFSQLLTEKKLNFNFDVLNFLSELIVHIINKDQTLADVHLVKTDGELIKQSAFYSI